MYDLFIDELKTDAADELMFRHIRKDWQSYELGLMRSKWFDYRYMHPVVATFAYAKAYDASWRRHFRASYGTATIKRVFANYDIFRLPKTTLAGLWRGRQHADALCMPYDVYTDLAFTQVLRFWKQAKMPMPQQLYSASVIEQLTAQWEEQQAGILRYGAHEEYRTHRFIGTKPQLDHHEWLFTQADKRANPIPIMGRFYDEGLIPFEKVEARYGKPAREILGLIAGRRNRAFCLSVYPASGLCAEHAPCLYAEHAFNPRGDHMTATCLPLAARIPLADQLFAKERDISATFDAIESIIGRSREISIARTQIELGFLMAQKAIGFTGLSPAPAAAEPDCAQQTER